MSKVKTIKALLGFHRTSDADLLKFLNTVHDGLKGNSVYATPPVDLATFKTDIDSFTVLVTDAADGGKKAISAKNKQRQVVIKMVKLLGHYDHLGIDSWCRKRFFEIHKKGRKTSDKVIERHYESLGKWRGLFFWMDLTRHWYEKEFPF